MYEIKDYEKYQNTFLVDKLITNKILNILRYKLLCFCLEISRQYLIYLCVSHERYLFC